MKLYKTKKTVLEIKNSPCQFLNGLTSNDLNKSQNAFLNIHGRIIATFDQVQKDEDTFWIIIEKDYTEKVLEHLDRYAKLSGVIIKNLDLNVFFNIDLELNNDLKNITCIVQKAGQLLISHEDLETSISPEEFTLFRLKNNIPFLGIDYKEEMILNVNGDDFVSFSKGCFLGQEPVSKVHNRSKPSWKLIVKLLDECTLEEKEKLTSKVLDPETNKEKGFIKVKND